MEILTELFPWLIQQLKSPASVTIVVVFPIIVAFFTTKITLKHDANKNIRERRELIYIEVAEILFELQKNRFLIYDREKIIGPMLLLRPKMRLYASMNVHCRFNILFRVISEIYTKDIELYESEDAVNAMVDYAAHNGKTLEEAEYENLRDRECSQENWLLSEVELRKYVENIILAMRKDLSVPSSRSPLLWIRMHWDNRN